MGRVLWVAGLALLACSTAAGAMTKPGAERCRVVGGELLPPDAGGPSAICNAIEKAAADQAPDLRFTVDVEVRSQHALSAVVTTSDGRRLSPQQLSVSDRKLSPSSFEWFAKRLVETVRSAAK